MRQAVLVLVAVCTAATVFSCSDPATTGCISDSECNGTRYCDAGECIALTYRKVEAGRDGTCAITSRGDIECWGDSGYGRSHVDGEFVDLSNHGMTMCALTDAGKIVCWGSSRPYYDSLPADERFSTIAIAYEEICGVRQDASVMCWGNEQVEVREGRFSFVGLSNSGTRCGLTTDHLIQCWGEGVDEILPQGQYRDLAVNDWTVCGVRMDGDLVCKPMYPYAPPLPAPPAGPFVAVAVGHGTACALRPGGEPVCWGKNEEGQASPPEDRFTQLSVGSTHACGLKHNGELRCWGSEAKLR